MLVSLIEDLNTPYFCLQRKVSIKTLLTARGSAAVQVIVLLLHFHVRTFSIVCIIDRDLWRKIALRNTLLCHVNSPKNSVPSNEIVLSCWDSH
jgi:hypothetical protein